MSWLAEEGQVAGNIVLGTRVLNGEGFGSKPKKKYTSIQTCHACICVHVCGCVHVASCMCLCCVSPGPLPPRPSAAHRGPIIIGPGPDERNFSGLRFRPVIHVHKSGVHGLRWPLYSGRRNWVRLKVHFQSDVFFPLSATHFNHQGVVLSVSGARANEW